MTIGTTLSQVQTRYQTEMQLYRLTSSSMLLFSFFNVSFVDVTILMAKRTYLGACLAWTCYVLLFPNWIGFSYGFDQHTRVIPVHRNGTQGSWGYRDGRSLLWKPPTTETYAKSRNRWPWQYPNYEFHVEIDWVLTLTRIFAGIIVFGAVFTAVTGAKKRGASFWIVVLVTVELFVVLSMMLFFGALAGRDLAQFIAVGGIAVGAVTILGVLSWCNPKCRAWLVSCLGNFQLTAKSTDDSGGQTRNGFQPSSDIPGIFVGILVGMFINWLTGFFEVLLRGRRYFMEGPRPSYELAELHDLGLPLDIAGGVAILAIGWSLGGFLFLYGTRRGFSVGLLVASTVLGLAFAFGC